MLHASRDCLRNQKKIMIPKLLDLIVEMGIMEKHIIGFQKLKIKY